MNQFKNNQPIIINRMMRDGMLKIGARYRWLILRVSIIALLVYLLGRQDWSIHFFIHTDGTNTPHKVEPMQTPSTDYQAASLVMPSGFSGKREQTKTTEIVKPAAIKKGNEKKSLLANPATAGGAAHSKKEKKLAAGLSNLGFILNPTYAKRHNIPESIVRQKQKLVFDYIKHYLPVAKEESRKFNIPVSIILAQGLLESNAGESNIALQARNHFGIKCFSHKCKKGHCLNFSDDSHKDFFLAFRSPEESYRAHSQFLIRGRYARLSRLPHGDYKGWAIGLRRAGYATDKGYAQKLIAIVERLHLHAFD